MLKTTKKLKPVNSFRIKKGKTGPDDPVLVVKNLSKNYGEFKALNKVSFELKKGERIGLIGGNGAGKTTISEIITGINQGTSGSITYGFEYKEKPQESLGMQFQDSNYPSGLTVKDIIAFARNVHHLDMSNDQLKGLLKIFQMEEFYAKNSRSLSGGQRQKLNILLSVLHKPNIIILDELSTGLDISAREEIIKFTDKLLEQNNMSAIVISHHTEEIRKICDKVIVLDRGKIIAQGKISDIEKKHGSLENFMRKNIELGNKNNEKTIDLQLDPTNKIFKTKINIFKKGGK